MGNGDRRLTNGVGERPERYEFAELIRHLRSRAESEAAARGNPESATDLRDIVRFRSHVSLSFPASDVHDVTFPDADDQSGESGQTGRAVVTVNFMGLANPTGPLPLHFAQFVIDRLRKRDTTSRDFFDIFNDLFIRKFALAWEKMRPCLAWERPGRGHGLEAYGAAFLGTASFAPDSASTAPGEVRSGAALSEFSGLLGRRPGSAASVAQTLRLLLRQRVEVLPFQPRWLSIPAEARARVGMMKLGEPVALGVRSLDHQSTFLVRVGPLTAKVFDSLMPGRPVHRRVADVVRFAVGAGFDFVLELRLLKGHVPGTEIRAGSGATCQLGMNTWLIGTPPFSGDASARLHVSGAGV